MEVGAWWSEIQGTIHWENSIPVAGATNWHTKQVLAVYLFPYLGEWIGLLLVYRILKYHTGWSAFPKLLVYWMFTFLLIQVFYTPLVDILFHKSLYYALAWLWIPYPVQVAGGIGLMLFFVFVMFRIARLFSSSLKISVNSEPMEIKRKITCDILYLWYAPILVLIASILITNLGQLTYTHGCFFTGMAVTFLSNTWLIRKYRVVV